MTAKRHAKPTVKRTPTPTLAIVLAELQRLRSDVLTLKRRGFQLKTITDHCARLLREKETLQRQLEALKEPFKIDESAPKMSAEEMASWEPMHSAQVTQAEIDKARAIRGAAAQDAREKIAADIYNRGFDGLVAPSVTNETRNYPCGCSATGNRLPEQCSIHGSLGLFTYPFNVVGGQRGALTPACAVAHLHRDGIHCAVCGKTPLSAWSE